MWALFIYWQFDSYRRFTKPSEDMPSVFTEIFISLQRWHLPFKIGVYCSQMANITISTRAPRSSCDCTIKALVLFFNTVLSVWLWLRAIRELASGWNFGKVFVHKSLFHTYSWGYVKGPQSCNGSWLKPSCMSPFKSQCSLDRAIFWKDVH